MIPGDRPAAPTDLLRGLAFGAVALGAVTLVKWGFLEDIGTPTPFLLYFGAVVVSAWFGGYGVGLATTVAAAVLGHVLFVDATRATGPASWIQIGLFCLEGTGISWITARLQREQRRAVANEREAWNAYNRLDTVLRGVDEGITVQDPSGRLVYANDVAATLTGFPTGEALVAAPIGEVVNRFELFAEDGSPLDPSALPSRVVFAGGTPSEVRVRFRVRGTEQETGAEQERWALVRASPVRDRDGTTLLAVNTFRDVSARKQHEESLRVSREWFSTALRSIGDAVIATDREGQVTFLNPVAVALTGWSPTDGEGRPLREVFQILDEETRAPVESPVERVIREDTVIGLSNHTILVRRDGSECAIDDSAAPIRDGNGALVGVVLVFRDVSARRQEEVRRAFLARATEELNSSLDTGRTLATVARLAVPTVADWCAVDMREAGGVRRLAIAHVDEEKVRLVAEIQRRYPSDPEAPTGTPAILRTGRSEMVSDIPAEVLDRAARDAEHLRLIRQLALRSYIGVPLKCAGETVGVITFAMAESNRRYDESDRALVEELAARAGLALEKATLFSEQVVARQDVEAARAEAELANRSKDEFLAILGHELRNPLAPILTALQIMKLRGRDTFERERTIIERQVRHVVRLVDDLLDISRITSGKVQIEEEPVDLAEVLTKALEMAGPLFEQRGHQVTVSVPTALYVSGNPVRLAQVFSNLLNNAARYTDPNGRISVVAERDGDDLAVTVSDSGMGISPEILPRIFDSFVQEKQALDRGQGGLGLGLSIVKSLVALHRGTVTVHSDGPGHGSRFVVRLPALPPDASTRVRTPSAPARAGDRRRVRILVVDDNTDAVALLSDALRMLGHETFPAHDGPAALALAAEAQPALALLDIGLPVMDGYELARRLRATPGLEGIRLVAVTGYGQESDRARSAEAGFDAHLVKPITLDLVQRTIDELLGS